MIRLLFEFPARRYHATPWGHHVNEGLVEWPPSPWRVIRALLATGYTKLGWEHAPEAMRELVYTLSEREPSYVVPRVVASHKRHFMPVKGWKKGVPKTGLVVDAFVHVDGALAIDWPVSLESKHRDLLVQLLERLSYLGRAESRVSARLADESTEVPGLVVSTRSAGDDLEPVRLLAPIPSTEYDSWRVAAPTAPDDLLAALHVETSTLQRNGWSAPPGSRALTYWRPAEALTSGTVGRASSAGARRRADTALFALATDTRRDVLPLMERAFPTMALFRRALLSHVGDDQQRGRCPELTGKDEQGVRLQNHHQHAHFIPVSLDHRNPLRIDHVLVHAPMGFDDLAERALRRLKRTWAKGMNDIAVTLVGLGERTEFSNVADIPFPLLRKHSVWTSRTPFFTPRFIKQNSVDSLEEQVKAEIHRRGLPALATPAVLTLPGEDSRAGRRARSFRRFARTRKDHDAGPPSSAFHLTLTFDRPIDGPLCLGWGSHFGLGLFEPVAEGE